MACRPRLKAVIENRHTRDEVVIRRPFPSVKNLYEIATLHHTQCSYRRENMSLSRKRACALIIVLETQKKKKRAYWVKDWLMKRNRLSHMSLMAELKLSCTDDYKNYLRMDETCFKTLLKLVTPLIKKQNTKMRSAITVEERLTATLRFLATGRSFEDMKYTTLISPQALGVIIPETCAAIYKVLKKEYLKFPKSSQEWAQIGKDFENRWNFPNCGGAIDGKHVRIIKPPNSGSYFYNYKGYCSIVLMAIVNADYEFVYVNCGCNGRVSDGGVLEVTDFFEKLTEGDLHLPNSDSTTSNLNFVFVGDDAFALNEHLLKPYPNKNLNNERRIFNYRLSRARNVVENAFGILANRFRILHTEINMKPEKIDLVVMACCVLHNFLRRNAKAVYMPPSSTDIEDLNSGTVINGNWREGYSMDGLQTSASRNVSQQAKDVREMYEHFFIGEGKVSWQDRFL